MKGIAFKGDVKAVCANLKAEVQKHKGWTLETYIRLKRLEAAEKKQFGEKVGV